MGHVSAWVHRNVVLGGRFMSTQWVCAFRNEQHGVHNTKGTLQYKWTQYTAETRLETPCPPAVSVGRRIYCSINRVTVLRYPCSICILTYIQACIVHVYLFQKHGHGVTVDNWTTAWLCSLQVSEQDNEQTVSVCDITNMFDGGVGVIMAAAY